MKILHLSWFADPHVGGVETHLRTLASSPRSQDLQHLIVSGTSDRRSAGSRYSSILDGSRPMAGHIAEEVETWDAAYGRPDIIHAHNLHVHDGARGREIMAAVRRRWPGTPLLLGVHNWVPRSHVLPSHSLDDVTVYSPFMRSVVAASTGVRATLLPCAFPIVQGRGVVRSPCQVVQPTRFSWWKGSYHALEAATRLQTDGAEISFLHLGVTPERAMAKWDSRADGAFPGLRERVQTALRRNRINFARLGSEQTLRCIARAGAVCHPTIGQGVEGEPFGISAAQAIITGRPTVLSASGNLRRFARSHSHALLVDPHDIGALADAVLRALRMLPLPFHRNPIGRSLASATLGAARQHCRYYEHLAA